MNSDPDLEKISQAYRDQGYSVTVRPGPDVLPAFARDFRIEMVARRGSEGVLVAVKKSRDDLAADGDVQRYAEVTGAQPGWRFDFAILEPENPMAREIRDAAEFSEEEITDSLQQAERLNALGFPRFAVIAAWAALEAAMRIRLRVAGEQAGWGTMPRQMVNELYSAGLLSPDEFRGINLASQLRNRIVHGFSNQSGESQSAEVADVQLLSRIADRLVRESRAARMPKPGTAGANTR